MAFFDRFRRQHNDGPVRPSIDEGINSKRFVCGADGSKDEYDIQTFDNSNISYRGDLNGFDYDMILRNKQKYMRDIYSLADYYCDSDDIIHGLIKHVYVPYSTCSPWQILNVGEKTRKLYEEKYRRMHLKEKLSSVMLQYWKYGNVVVYYFKGNIITLPIHKCRIGNLMVNGDPIVDFDCTSIITEWVNKGYSVKENWIDDNDLRSAFKGYPPEVVEAINQGYNFAQLDIHNTYVMQGEKEDWERYSIPFIVSCLKYLGKKALISKYEDAMLNLGIRSFVHVKYGDIKNDIQPDLPQLREVRNVFSRAMSGYPLAVTNQLADTDVVKPDNDDLFQWDKYRNVNQSILSAGGISGLLVNGTSDDNSTFASAQVSMNTAAARIEFARDKFCEMMDRINKRILEDMKLEHKNNLKQEPRFVFMPLDMSGRKALIESCKELWENGVVSTRTMMDVNGYSLEREKHLKEIEANDGTDEIFIPRKDSVARIVTRNEVTHELVNDNEGTGKVGRPEMTDEERTSDPENAIRGRMPKPSNPEGSEEPDGDGGI